ncbi:MAG: sensor histidine kinase [Nitrincola lacisaponensis]|uniref:sensor histidine kinase n=1 Tax=Nitrincola lacisaponensis TaxID=267850 RepID=UPI00391877FE
MSAGVPRSDWRHETLEMWQAFVRFFASPTGLFRAICLLACVAIYVLGRMREALSAENDMILTLSGETLARQWLGDAVTALIFSEAFVLAAFVIFVVAFCMVMAPYAYRHSRTPRVLTVQIAIGLMFNEELLLIVAAQLPFLYPLPKAFVWLLAQALLKVLLWSVILMTADPMGAVIIAAELADIELPAISLVSLLAMAIVMFFFWQLFAFCLGFMAMSERRQRYRLAKAYAELMATRQLLEDSARSSERLRISRDMHDGLGHHLAALNLHLELAIRKPESMMSSVYTARDIAKELYQEVRMTIERELLAVPINLSRSLQTLCSGIPEPHIELRYDPGCQVRDPALAHVIFRCVQEALSNTLRHANAHKVEISVEWKANDIYVCIVDDGCGATRIVPGNGLTGIRERVEEVGGSVEVEARPGAGCQVQLWLPMEGGKA